MYKKSNNKRSTSKWNNWQIIRQFALFQLLYCVVLSIRLCVHSCNTSFLCLFHFVSIYDNSKKKLQIQTEFNMCFLFIIFICMFLNNDYQICQTIWVRMRVNEKISLNWHFKCLTSTSGYWHTVVIIVYI